jgi:branched-chain amino acid transport system substrate-binding protein
VKKILIITVAALITFAALNVNAAGSRPDYPENVSPEIKQSFDAADQLYRSGDKKAADQAFEQFIANHEYNQLTDAARFLRGEIRFEKKKYDEALPFYRAATEGIYSPLITPNAHLKSGLALYHLKNYGAAIDEVSKISRQDTSPDVLVRADSVGLLAGKESGWPSKRLVRFALFLVDDYIDLGGSTDKLKGYSNIVSEKDAHDFVTNWINDTTVVQSDIDALPTASYAKKPSGGYLLYKEALVARQDGDMKKATKLLKRFTGGYPKNSYYATATAQLSESSARAGISGFKIGVILPLSGKYRVFGESVLHGIECAVGLYTPCEGPKDMQLVVKDSRGSPAAAAEAVDALAEEKVEAIIGPMLSATVTSAANRAQQIGIPLIALSQRGGIAEIGDFIFRNSVTSKSQVSSLVDYTVKQKKMKRFFILFPNNRMGEEFRDLFSMAAKDAGGIVVSSQSYNPRSQDIVSELRGLQFHTGNIDMTQEKGKRAYDAIFLPGSAWAATVIAPMLEMREVTGVQLLGTMRWNDPNFYKRGGKYLNGAIFVVAFDRGSNDLATHEFVDRFTQAYKVEPTLLEALGYDSMKLVLAASAQGARSRPSIRDILKGISSYRGVTGELKVDENGEIERKLTIMQIKNGKAAAVAQD